MRKILLALALIQSPSQAWADMNSPAPVIDISAMNAQIAAAVATANAASSTASSACQPQAVVPPLETVTGAAGSGSNCRLSNAVQPRITRAAMCTLDGNGACSITWSTALSGTPTVILTPINPSATQPMMCNPTATPTTTGVSLKCWQVQTTTLSLAIVTSGLNLLPAIPAPTGTTVQAVALPTTQ